MIDGQMIDEIVYRKKNIKLEEVRQKAHENKSSYRPTEEQEIKALLALFVLAAIFKSQHESVYSLFFPDNTGRQIFRAVLTLCLRFDNATIQDKLESKIILQLPFQSYFSKLIHLEKIQVLTKCWLHFRDGASSRYICQKSQTSMD